MDSNIIYPSGQSDPSVSLASTFGRAFAAETLTQLAPYVQQGVNATLQDPGSQQILASQLGTIVQQNMNKIITGIFALGLFGTGLYLVLRKGK